MKSSAYQPPADALSLPFGFARRYGVVLDRGGAQTVLCCRAGLAPETLAEVGRVLEGRLPPCRTVDSAAFDALLSAAYERDSAETMQMVEDLGSEMDLASIANAVPETEDLLEQENDAPIIRLINALLAEAIRAGASDIHIEPFERRLVVRFRIDGMLREMVQPKRELATLLVSRVKVMARLDIAEKRVPQDGRISLRIGGREVDIRVSTLPATNGERVVLRLLDKQAGRLALDTLGMAEALRFELGELLYRPHGILLVTGPTGSGKTTTLYAGLSAINDTTRNILTVEDPIEYNLEGIGQTQVNLKADMTFARGLRAMLRQDPDVVMVGEIRDLETAEIAVQASLTGHLVLSTLHTNTAAGAVTRLRDMGIEPYLLASSLIGVLAQRLVRVLCSACRKTAQPNSLERSFLALPANEDATIWRPVGCEQCQHSGYQGRRGIYELLSVNEVVRELIHREATEQEIIGALGEGHTGIRGHGRALVLAGETSVEEVLRVTQED